MTPSKSPCCIWFWAWLTCFTRSCGGICLFCNCFDRLDFFDIFIPFIGQRLPEFFSWHYAVTVFSFAWLCKSFRRSLEKKNNLPVAFKRVFKRRKNFAGVVPDTL